MGMLRDGPWGHFSWASNGHVKGTAARAGTFHGGRGGNGQVKGWLVMGNFLMDKGHVK